MYKKSAITWEKVFCSSQSYIKAALCLVATLCVVMVPFFSAESFARKTGFILTAGQDDMVNIMLGKADIIDINGDVSDIMVADPTIVDVTVVRNDRLYIVGSNLGDTNVIALDADGNIIKRFNVHVQMDVSKVERTIAELYPESDVEVRALTDQVVLTGSVSTPAVANQITNLVGHYAGEIQELEGNLDEIIVNLLEVRGEQQVMLRVRIVEASRSTLKDLGLEFDTRGSGNLTRGSEIGRVGTTFRTATQLGLTAPVQLGTAALRLFSGGIGDLTYIARLLEEEGIINTLAEPNLTAISGEQAGFLAGGEIPVPTGLDRQGNLVFEFRPFGVSLNFRPVVLSENRISMQLSTEVSTASQDQNLQIFGVSVPNFNVRRAETTVELSSGGTLMIAGLLQSNSTAGLTDLPGVNDIPIIGDLIKSDSFERDESELLVMVTPYLVEPFADSKQSNSVPGPERDEGQMGKIFGDNIRRTYGERAPSHLTTQIGSYGYMMD